MNMRKLTAIVLALLMLCGMLTLPAAAEEGTSSATSDPRDIVGASLSLKDSVYIYFMLDAAVSEGATDYGVIFYLSNPGENASYAAATAAGSTAVVRGKSSAYAWTDSATSKSYFSFNYGVYAKQMTDIIYGQGYACVNGEYVCGRVVPYSVQTYAANKLGLTPGANPSNVTSDAKLVNLLVAQLKYGAFSQKYLKYNEDNLADSILPYGLEFRGNDWENVTASVTGSYSGTSTKLVIPQIALWGDCVGRPVVAVDNINLAESVTDVVIPATVTGIQSGTFSEAATPGVYKNANNWHDNRYYVVGGWLIADTVAADAMNNAEITSYTCALPEGVVGMVWDVYCITYEPYNTKLTSVSLPKSLKVLPGQAFYRCQALAEVTFAEGSELETISYSAFAGCTSLESITLPEGLKLIDGEAFSECTALKEIAIPASVEYIGHYAFSSYDSAAKACTSMTTLTFASGSKLETVEACAFYNCSALTTINGFPTSVTSLNRDAFKNTAYYNDTSKWVNSTLSLGGWLLHVSSGFTGTIEISSEHVTGGAAQECSGLTGVTFTSNVKSIGDSAFEGCKTLETVTFNTTQLTSIGFAAFRGCEKLTSISIPSTVTSIDRETFASCKGLTSITIPSTVTSIGDGAFTDCTKLATIIIPRSVKSIGEVAFKGCTALKTINYTGTEAEWNAVAKYTSADHPEHNWNDGVSADCVIVYNYTAQ